MDNIFIIKIVISFFIGGFLIASVSFWAEYAQQKMAGIIMALPTTSVISFIFIAWTLSPQAVADIVPSTIIGAGATQFFTISYAYLSKIKTNKKASLLISITGSLVVWLVFSIPFAIIKFSNIFLALLIYSQTVLIGYYFLTVKNKKDNKPILLKYTPWQKIGRGVFAGLVISLAVLLSKILQPFWGGILSGFPALFTSTFLVLHWYRGTEMIQKVTQTIPIGSLVYVVFALVVRITYPSLGILLGTIISYLASLLIFFVIFKKTKTAN